MTRVATKTEHASLALRALLGTRALIDRMRTLYRELEQLTDAPITVHRALVCLGEKPGITASNLAAALGIQRPALSQVLKGLVERGWVERVRSDSDQRSVRVYLTSAGRQILAATTGRAVGMLQRAVRQLSEAELAGLAAGVEKVLFHLAAPANEGIQRARPRSKRRSTTRVVEGVRGGTTKTSGVKRRAYGRLDS